MSFTDYQEYTSITLDKIQVGVSKAIAKEYCNHINVDILIEEVSKSIIVKLLKWDYAENLQNEKVFVKYPKTLFQYFKEKYAPKFIKKKYPVKYKEYKVTFKRNAVYPQLHKFIKNDDATFHKIKESITLGDLE